MNRSVSTTLVSAALVAVALAGCASVSTALPTAAVAGNSAIAFPVSVAIEGARSYKGLNSRAQQGGVDNSWNGATSLMERAFTGAPQANWIFVDELFAVSTEDNRGCAPAPRSIDVLSASSIVVNLGQDDCTFEYYEGPYTTELELPDDVTGRPITVAFRFLDETVDPGTDASGAAEMLDHDVLR